MFGLLVFVYVIAGKSHIIKFVTPFWGWILNSKASRDYWKSILLGAVNGGADGVANADAALAGESGGDAHIDAFNVSGDLFQAFAGSLAVGGGGGGVGESLNGGTATGRQSRNLTLHITKAWAELRNHRAASNGRLRIRRHHNHAQNHHACNLHRKLCHYYCYVCS